MSTHARQMFENIGAEFVSGYEQLTEKAMQIRAFVFDWDGVFNNGSKGENQHSSFAEPDVAGLNYLRFANWLQHGQSMPLVAIITGEHNPSAFKMALRENFNTVCFRFSSKVKALEMLLEEHGLQGNQVAFLFDDVLDLEMAQHCGLRIMIRRKASPLLADYVRQRQLCDYISGHEGGHHAVREVSELLMAATGTYNKAIDERIRFAEPYKQFIAEKKAVSTQIFTMQQGQILPYQA